MNCLKRLSATEAKSCCEAFLSHLYTSETYKRWQDVKEMWLGPAASESEFMNWIINSVQIIKPQIFETIHVYDESLMNHNSIKQELEAGSQQQAQVGSCHVTECCESLLTMLYGDTVYSQWRKIKRVMSFDTEAALAQWCLDVVQDEWQSVSTMNRGEGNDEQTNRGTLSNDWKECAHNDMKGPHFTCAVCEQTFLTQLLLEHHLTTVHLKLEPTDTDDGDPLSCDLCTLVADDKSHLVKHYVTQHPDYRPYLCRYCGRTFKHEKHMKEHWYKWHGAKDECDITDRWTKYQCCYCDNTIIFTAERLLKTHIYYSHRKERIMQQQKDGIPRNAAATCDLCSFICSKNSQLQKHYIEQHADYRPYLCRYCGHPFKHEKHRKAHWYKVHGFTDLTKVAASELWPEYQCCYCSEMFSFERLLKVHIYHSHSQERRVRNVKCTTTLPLNESKAHISLPVDNTTFNSSSDQLQTVNELACGCGFITDSQDSLDMHKKSCNCEDLVKHDAKGCKTSKLRVVHLQCGVCGYVARRPSELRRHEAYHKDDRPFPCPLCPKAFKTNTNLQAHLKKVHRDRSLDASSASNSLKHAKVKVEKAFECSECEAGPRCFVTRSRLEVHIQRVHKDKIKRDEVQLVVRRFTCKYCRRPVKGYYNLLNHIERIHERNKEKYTCDVCGWQCTNMRDFRKHELVKHRVLLDDTDNITGYYCEVCQKTFCEQSEVREHIHRDHVRARKVMCDVCGMAFLNESTMKRHRSSHSSDRTALCPHCPNMFKNDPTLQRHIKAVHRQERNFTCDQDQCAFRCSTSGNLYSHQVFVHHKPTDYQCNVCQKYFPNSHHLVLHMNKHGY